MRKSSQRPRDQCPPIKRVTATYAGDKAANLTVMPEVAVIQSVGPDIVSTADGSTITLTASLAEEADSHYGKLDTASATIPMLPEGLYTIETEVQSWGLYVAAHVASPLLVDTPVDGSLLNMYHDKASQRLLKVQVRHQPTAGTD